MRTHYKNLLISLIHSYHDYYLPVDEDVAELPTITKSSLLTFFKEVIHPSSKTQKKLSTHLYSQNPPPPSPSSKTGDINNLFNCLQSHSLTSDIGLQDLHNYFELESFGSLDSSETEKILRKFLGERVKTDETGMEELVKNRLDYVDYETKCKELERELIIKQDAIAELSSKHAILESELKQKPNTQVIKSLEKICIGMAVKSSELVKLSFGDLSEAITKKDLNALGIVPFQIHGHLKAMEIDLSHETIGDRLKNSLQYLEPYVAHRKTEEES